MFSYVDSVRSEQLQLLRRLVNIDSDTFNKPGVDEAGTILATELDKLGLQVRVVPQREVGNHLLGYKPGTAGRDVLLVGHLDTVHLRGSALAHPFRIEGERAYGPGVYDMKGGLVVALFALKALQEKRPETWNRVGVRLVFNTDEETGSDTSRELIAEQARSAAAACILEPARKGGEYVSERKGVGTFTLTVQGKSAHAGAQPELGANSIAELATKVVALQGLNGSDAGFSVNVGVIRGGERANVVPALAECQIDVRVTAAAAMERAQAQLRRIAAAVSVPGTRAVLTGGFKHYPMTASPGQQALFRLLEKVGAEVGFAVRQVATGGASDGNTTSRYTPTLDGMGPRGDLAHSPDEYVEVDSLPERTKALARFIELWAT